MASKLLDLARAYRRALEAQDERALRRLIDAYGLMWGRLSGRVDALLLEIERDGVKASAVAKLARYKSLMAQIDDEVSRYSSFLLTELDLSTNDAVRLGLAHSRTFTQALLQQAGITARLDSLSVNAVKQMLGFLQEGSPLYDRIGELTGVQAQRVRDALLEGIGLGWNPRKTADAIFNAFSMGLTDALRMTRTADLWSYRESARANYQASNVVTGWMWWAELDGDTCGACMAEHGSVHSLDETLDGHHNCRCAPIPYIEGMSEPEQTGEEWFNAQSEDVQRAALGKGKYEAWREGKFSFSQLAAQGEDAVYGSMKREATLEELVGADG